MNTDNTERIKALKKLLLIKDRSDIRSIEVKEMYEDDHCMCADTVINGIPLFFGWYDSLGFLDYWKDSDKAFEDLKKSIKCSVACLVDLEG